VYICNLFVNAYDGSKENLHVTLVNVKTTSNANEKYKKVEYSCQQLATIVRECNAGAR